ncbi:MAG: hypothetical protein KF901_32590 [Myxococcales bacterium]|nr:hypothetical protein [Myxococcales bacterium]
MTLRSDRLKDIDPEFARLVAALRANGPSKDALAKTLGAVASASASPAPPPRSRSLTIASWAGIGAAIVALTVGGSRWMLEREPRRAAAPSQASAPPPLPPAESPSTPDIPTSTVSVGDLPPALSPAPPKVSAVKLPQPNAARPAVRDDIAVDDFREELLLVERIRRELSRGESSSCLRSIEQYGERFERGVLGDEVEVMHVEALALSGDAVIARIAGEQFIARHPKSPYVGRLRTILEKMK